MRMTVRSFTPLVFLLIACGIELSASGSPYDNPPPAEPPYYRVRYEASTRPDELTYPVAYIVWVPPYVKVLRAQCRPRIAGHSTC